MARPRAYRISARRAASQPAQPAAHLLLRGHGLRLAPRGVILDAADRLVGPDIDVVFLPALQPGDLLAEGARLTDGRLRLRSGFRCCRARRL